MNVLNGIVESVAVNGNLSLVRVRVGEIHLSSIVVDTPETVSYLQQDHPVQVIFKETEVIIGKGDDHQISLQNRMVGTIRTIETGDLLSKLTLDTTIGPIVSVITANAVRQLELAEGMRVTAMIKTNEMMLSE